MEKNMKKILAAAALVLVAVISFTFVADKAASPTTYAKTIDSIDAKVDTVLKLTASSAMASAGVSAIPGDTATPIAEKLAEFTEYFLVVLCVLYSEKFLLTVGGAAAFRVIIPIACLLLGASIFCKKDLLRRLGMKFFICSIILYLAVPMSIRVSDVIYSSCEDTINTTIMQTQSLTEKTDAFSMTNEDETAMASVWERISETAGTLADKAARILNRFVETLAVFIVTSCVIPVLTMVFFLWVIKVFANIDSRQTIIKLLPENGRRRASESSNP